MHKLANIWRSKGNQTKKFSQLIEPNMKNIFLEKSYTNVMEKLVPDPFLKNENWAYVWNNSLKCYAVYFYCMAS